MGFMVDVSLYHDITTVTAGFKTGYNYGRATL